MSRYRSYGQLDDPAIDDGDQQFSGVNEFDDMENLQPGQVQAAVNIDFSDQNAVTRPGFVCLPALGIAPFGTYFTGHSGASTNAWRAVAYGLGQFVAVSESGSGNRVMTSPDGAIWTSRTSAADNGWRGVCFGNNLFVAVSGTGGATDGVMTSPDGITWTARVPASDDAWLSVIYGNGLYVSVGTTATNRVMTSPDGITWTARASADDTKFWGAVTYANGLYVAVASSASTQNIMTSPDGLTWTLRTHASASLSSVAYGNGRFCAVGLNVGSSANVALTSTDGITWALAETFSFSTSVNIGFGNGSFVMIGSNGSVYTSPDGDNWSVRTAVAANAWRGVAYGNGMFVVVASSGALNTMVSGAQSVWASGIYSDPNDPGSQWIILVGTDTVGFYAFGRTARTVLISGYTVTQDSTVVQCNNLVYIFRGPNDTPLYWTGDWAIPFTVAPTPSPLTGFRIIPNSNQATYYQNRLWVPFSKDFVAASDVLDFTAFDELANDFNLNTGNSDFVITTYPFGENGLVVFKNNSSMLLQHVEGSLTDVTATEITRNLGITGINAVTAVGPDLVYFSGQGVSSIRLNLQNQLQNLTQPLSRNIAKIIERVNTQAIDKVTIGFWKNQLFVALPLDGSVVCNAIAVYNFVTEQWFGEWTFDANINMAIQGFVTVNYLGHTHLHVVTEDGRVFVIEGGQNDISGTLVAEIATSVTTRAYVMDNSIRFARRLYLDLSTNRPNYSVTAYTDGASESSEEVADQTYSRSRSWIFSDSAYDLTNANDDYNRAFRKDYSSGPNSVQPGSGIEPEMSQSFRLPLITRRSGRLQWMKVENATGFLSVNSAGFEARAGYRGNLISV